MLSIESLNDPSITKSLQLKAPFIVVTNVYEESVDTVPLSVIIPAIICCSPGFRTTKDPTLFFAI